MNDLVSVIVPVYNVERYLTRCVESILAQSYQNIEIILVDDGSTDRSGKICDEFASNDNRVSVIHKPNGGLSDARNIGIVNASGDYVVFCDSDDWIEQTILQDALLSAKKIGTEIVIWGYSADFVDMNETILYQKDYVPENCIFIKGKDNKELSSELLMGLMGYAWNKLYKRDLIKELRFDKGVSLVEDILFNRYAIVNTKQIAFLRTIGTHYIQRSRETLGTKYYPNYFELKYRASQAREAILISYGFAGRELSDAMASQCLGVLESVVRMASRTKHFQTNHERKRYLSSVFVTAEAKSILEKYRPQGTKRIFLHLLMKAKAYSIMIWIFQNK